MKNCMSCSKQNNEIFFECENCGATFCEDCSNKTQKICPKCYSNLQLKN